MSIRWLTRKSAHNAPKPEKTRLRFNFGVGRNMFMRSLSIASIYGVTNTLLIKFEIIGFRWIDLWPIIAFPTVWLIDYFVIWRQEVDSNFLVSKEWQRHVNEIEKISQKLSQLERRIQ